MKLIVKTLSNLETILAQELENLGAKDIEISKRAVSCEGDEALLYKANLCLHTALRVLMPIMQFEVQSEDDFYEKMKELPWEKYMTAKQTFVVDTILYSERFSNSQYLTYRTKDAIVDHFKELSDLRPSVRLNNPDIYINIHISHQAVTVSLDSSGESLHKRGYRTRQTDAPLNEVLAAGILLKTGWNGSQDLIDPMCGSGTFLIEAGLIAKGIPPGIFRSHFAFEAWRTFNSELYTQIYESVSETKPFLHKIFGSDILRESIRISSDNIEKAGLSDIIELQVKPFQELPSPQRPCMIIMNPPYGARLKIDENFYDMIGQRLKHQFSGCKVFILAHKKEQFNQIGLHPFMKEQLFNGSLECELRGYELFEGKRNDFLAENPQERRQSRGERGERLKRVSKFSTSSSKVNGAKRKNAPQKSRASAQYTKLADSSNSTNKIWRPKSSRQQKETPEDFREKKNSFGQSRNKANQEKTNPNFAKKQRRESLRRELGLTVNRDRTNEIQVIKNDSTKISK